MYRRLAVNRACISKIFCASRWLQLASRSGLILSLKQIRFSINSAHATQATQPHHAAKVEGHTVMCPGHADGLFVLWVAWAANISMARNGHHHLLGATSPCTPRSRAYLMCPEHPDGRFCFMGDLGRALNDSTQLSP